MLLSMSSIFQRRTHWQMRSFERIFGDLLSIGRFVSTSGVIAQPMPLISSGFRKMSACLSGGNVVEDELEYAQEHIIPLIEGTIDGEMLFDGEKLRNLYPDPIGKLVEVFKPISQALQLIVRIGPLYEKGSPLPNQYYVRWEQKYTPGYTVESKNGS
jgi:hypothetical protein